jgi:DNA-binding LacI/PurR family transcriptional regulator
MPAPRPATARDVAARLGVSTRTVANAFTRPDQLSAELRRRVHSTAAELGYPGPNPLAAGLRRGRVGAIGLAYDNALSYAVEDPAAVDLLAGAAAVLEPAAASLLLVAGSSAATTSRAAAAGALVDGVIVASVAEDDPFLLAALARRLPVAVVDQPRSDVLARSGTTVPWVGIDDAAAARTVTEHLLALGHRRLAVVSFALAPDGRTGPADLRRRMTAPYAVTAARLRGYAGALGAAGIDWAGVPVLECAGSLRAAGRAAAATLLAAPEPPTAVLATSDQLALGVLDAAAEAGVAVPAALSVTGFDDVPAAAPAGLTTIAQDHGAKGRAAADLLLAALRGEPPSAPPPLPHALVVRASTAPPPA